jgi:DNA-binding FrmR family transcriptional regulator
MDHKEQIPRLNRIEGQVRGITRMIRDERYCVDILTQLRAVSRALDKVHENVFREHLEGCVRESMEGGRPEEKSVKIDEILELLAKFR